jgi:cell division protein FtsL
MLHLIGHLSRKRYLHTILWSVVLSISIVIAASALARATHNFRAALSEKPDIAIYLLLPEEEIGRTTLLKSSETERDYLAETKHGPKIVKLRKGEKEWYVSYVERLHE